MGNPVRTCLCVCIVCIAVLVLLNVVIYHSHHITCYFHPNLCLPWTNWLKQLRILPEMMTAEELEIAAFQMWEHNVTVQSACRRTQSQFIHPCPSRIKWGILLGQRHGGTNWVMGELNEYDHVTVRAELLIGTSV